MGYFSLLNNILLISLGWFYIVCIIIGAFNECHIIEFGNRNICYFYESLCISLMDWLLDCGL